MECVYCHKKFTNKSILTRHQKQAKFCLRLQKSPRCIYCQEVFRNEEDYEAHQSSYCAHRIDLPDVLKEKDKTILKLEQKITELEGRLENIAVKASQRPTNVTNYNFLQPVTKERLDQCSSQLTIDHILKGPAGYAEFALEHSLKDSVVCVDYSRRKVKFRNEDGNIVTDPEMTSLGKKFFQSIKDKNRELINEYGRKLNINLAEYDMQLIEDLLNFKSSVDRGSDGEQSEFKHDFVKEVCSQTIKEE